MNLTHLQKRMEQSGKWNPEEELTMSRHLNHFSQDSIAKIFNINGLIQNQTQKLIWDAFYISFMSEKYRQKSLPLLRGIYCGMISNMKARKNGEWSSLVYVFEKRI